MDTDTSPHQDTLRTPEEVLAWFRAECISIAGWCRKYGFSRDVVNGLLYRGHSGKKSKQATRAAVLLGLRAAPEPAQTGGTNG